MVVGFVFEQQEPRLSDAVCLHLHLHRAGVDFVAFIQIRELSLAFQCPGGDGGDVHQTNRRRSAELPAQLQIFLIGFLQERVFKVNGVNDRQKRRMPAVIGPVGVRHAKLRHGGVTLLGAEIIPEKDKIVNVHGKSVFLTEGFQRRAIKPGKAVQCFHLFRNFIGDAERFGEIQ